MGQEIAEDHVAEDRLAAYREHLRGETKILKRWFDERAFDQSETLTSGLEVEAWLIDGNSLPAPRNEEFLHTVNHPLVVPELSRFNFEINADPRALTGCFLSDTQHHLETLWARCRDAAMDLELCPLMIGILPTVRDEMLQPAWMSDSNRYRMLNSRLFELRAAEPFHIDIAGEDRLDYRCDHIMLEAACTSLQCHLKVNQDEAVRLYNASVLASGPITAAAANAPFLYGKSLWAETRIPAFEQSTAVLGFHDVEGRSVKRVSLGTGYLRHSFLEPWLENMSFPPILPILHEDCTKLPHLRLQNGTIWRWNRPILGFDSAGRPHLRIEQRSMPAGPSIPDTVANMALYFGLALALGRADVPPETATNFEDARANFYACAKDGLRATVCWEGRRVPVQTLLLDSLLPQAKAALAGEGAEADDLDYYFDHILRPRLLSGRNGAHWQRSFQRVNGWNLQALTEAYCAHQKTGEPAHLWVA